MVKPHILIVTYPAQGHIKPSLQFAKRLICRGKDVTFTTTVYAQRCMAKANGGVPKGLNFTAFSDGYDDGFRQDHDDVECFMREMRTRGSQAVKDIVSSCESQGRPVTAIVRTILLPWVAEAAREIHVPSALLWIQPAAVLDIYFFYFHGYGDAFGDVESDESFSVELPGLPPLSGRDLPSFLLPSGQIGSYGFVLPQFKEEIDNLDREINPTVLVNTFDALEPEAIGAIEKYKLVGVGPLIPGRDGDDKSFSGDLFEKSKDDSSINEWLSSQPESSVVYVSFGSMINPSKQQKEAIARALLETKRPFLWVIRKKLDIEIQEGKGEEELSCMEELEKQGMIVPWCSQIGVLSHSALGCFVTHCGWNSTLESICSGVPVVAFPHWTDQGTNAKLIQDVWRTGVRVTTNGQDDVVSCEEIKRCIEAVMDDGDLAEELRRNAKKWKDLAAEAIGDGGSSDMNLKAFAGEVAN